MSESHEPFEMNDRALEDMLAELRGTSTFDQLKAALETLAFGVATYYGLLIQRGVPEGFAAALTANYQHDILTRARE